MKTKSKNREVGEEKQKRPRQKQNEQPGKTEMMDPQPEDKMRNYLANGKLKNKIALVTGGDSGIGRAVAIGFAKEGADVAIVYLDEHDDATETKKYIEREGRKAILIPGDVGDETFCKEAVEEVEQAFGRIDILVNNAGEQHPQDSIEDITEEQLTRTFRTNIFSFFFMVKHALPYFKEDGAIINTASITAYEGRKELIDYSATKGAIVTFTRSLSELLVEKKIRVNAVAPGPIWTPLIPSTFNSKHVKEFGSDTPMKRAGEPDEVAPAYIFLASDDASYITGQTIHVNGGTVING
jgi:NAD(P)-dependent dehydrogenase (short-subunit alcohol dehydrogenase family)